MCSDAGFVAGFCSQTSIHTQPPTKGTSERWRAHTHTLSGCTIELCVHRVVWCLRVFRLWNPHGAVWPMIETANWIGKWRVDALATAAASRTRSRHFCESVFCGSRENWIVTATATAKRLTDAHSYPLTLRAAHIFQFIKIVEFYEFIFYVVCRRDGMAKRNSFATFFHLNLLWAMVFILFYYIFSRFIAFSFNLYIKRKLFDCCFAAAADVVVVVALDERRRRRRQFVVFFLSFFYFERSLTLVRRFIATHNIVCAVRCVCVWFMNHDYDGHFLVFLLLLSCVAHELNSTKRKWKN